MNDYQANIISQYEENLARINSSVENLEEEIFNKKPADGKWSAAECIDHLVTTNGLYFDQLEGVSADSSGSNNSVQDYTPRKAAEKIIKMMEPPVKLKVKAPSKFKPHADHKKNELLKKYSETQSKIIEKLKLLSNDQMKMKITSPVSKLVKLQAGEVFLLIAVHDRRHIWQAENTLKLVV